MSMIVYRQRAPQIGAVESALWASTGDIDTETRSLGISIKQLARDMFEDNSISGASDAYQVFLRTWNAFIADFNQWESSSWFWNPTRRDQLLDFRARFNSLLAKFQSFGGATGATALKAEAEPSSLDKAGDLANKLVWIVGIGAAIWVASTVYKETRGRT